MNPSEERRPNRPVRGSGASRDGKKSYEKRSTPSYGSKEPRRGATSKVTRTGSDRPAKSFDKPSFSDYKGKPSEGRGKDFKSSRTEGNESRPYKNFEKKSYNDFKGSRPDSRDSRDSRPSNNSDFKPRFASKPQGGDSKPAFNRYANEDDKGGYSRGSEKPAFKTFKNPRTDSHDSRDKGINEGSSDFVPRFSKKLADGERPTFNRFAKDTRGEFKETRFDEGKKMRPRLKSTPGEEGETAPAYDPNAKYSKKKQLEHNKKNLDPSAPYRLNKFLANAGFCSRREADEYIKAGVVTVNGEVVTEMGAKVLATDKVLFHDQLVRSEKKVYVLLNKPKDCVTTTEDTNSRLTVMDLVKNACTERIYPVGRLDRNTTGVLLLTNDGDLAAKLMHPKHNKKKIYHAHLDKPLTKNDMQRIADGVELEDGMIKADDIHYVEDDDKKQIGIEIHSGRNRLVRRIFEHLGYNVVRLDRVFFAGLTKKQLSRGQWRHLSPKEVEMLRMGAFE